MLDERFGQQRGVNGSAVAAANHQPGVGQHKEIGGRTATTKAATAKASAVEAVEIEPHWQPRSLRNAVRSVVGDGLACSYEGAGVVVFG